MTYEADIQRQRVEVYNAARPRRRAALRSRRWRRRLSFLLTLGLLGRWS